MTKTLMFIAPLLLVGCATGAGGVAQDTDPGTQIGGIDCETDKLLLTVEDADSAGVEAEVVIDFPDGDRLEDTCRASGCNLELSGPGSYDLSVDAGAAGTASQTVVLDDSNIAGQLALDCGDRPFHEVSLTIAVSTDDGGGDGGDIYTSNLGVRAFASDGSPMAGMLTIAAGPMDSGTIPCRASRCWVDIEGAGSYDLTFAGDNGENGSETVVITAADIVGANEVGDDIYERDLRIDLR